MLLIDVEAKIDAFERMATGLTYQGKLKEAIDYAVAAKVLRESDLSKVVEAEPMQHGQWMKDDLYNTICSVCGERIPCIEEYDTDEDCGGPYDVEIDETPRCPNCGAKMDEGEKE